MTHEIAIDIGGTFIDAIALDRSTGRLRRGKVPADPGRLRAGVGEAIDGLGVAPGDVGKFVHGTTLGVNAVVEADGATVGLLTNAGFEDVLEIGRETVPDAHRYEMGYRRPPPLVPRRRRLGVPGRIGPDGEEIEPLDAAAVDAAVETLRDDHAVEAIAVCFLHAYLNPAHERRARARIEATAPDVSVSLSSDIAKEYGEFERSSTTAIEAYIRPTFESYVDGLLGDLEEAGFSGNAFITRSGGGAVSAATAREAPVHTLFSGPAGGVMGCSALAGALGIDSHLALDIGGTTTDACVAHGGDPAIEYESTIDDRPVVIPKFDIRSIGAGGGSVAWADRGLLRVGPRSAGAVPGPACYGRGGEEPTVTDAAAVVGYLRPERFLRGELTLEADRAEAALRREIADPLDLSLTEAGSGVFRVAVSNITNAVAELTVEAGLDPREFAAVAYGGAGPMLVPMVARELALEAVYVPRFPAVFSSWGMLRADVVHDAARTDIVRLAAADPDRVRERLAALEAELAESLGAEGFGPAERRFDHAIELRYLGQEHTVRVPVDGGAPLDGLEPAFEAAYRARYNHVQDGPVELVTLRCRGIGPASSDAMPAPPDEPGGEAPGRRDSYCLAEGAVVPFAVHDRAGLSVGRTVDGPAIIEEPTSTTVIHTDQAATVLDGGHLRVRGDA